ncbi:MAG TPA: TlpA disulfide reductase family protein [Rhizomicrobium sp.]|nr:TlpA disulfide reductase family protein [Rhizomicrobium sp.]
MKSRLQAATLGVSLIAILAGSNAANAADTSAINGRWDAMLSRDGVDIPFRLDIKGQGQNLKGVFYDGFKPYDGTTSASFKDGELVLNIEHYLTTIDAKLDHGRLSGTLATKGRASDYSFEATRHVESAAAPVKTPQIAGSWVIPLEAPSSKGEKAFRFVVQQHGPEVAAAILRIDGDTGSYSGSYLDGKWVLSHFDGGRPGVIIVTPKPDGSLEIQQHVDSHSTANVKPDGGRAAILTAYRTDVAEAKGLPKPDDFLTHTTAKDPDAAFKFAFPDLDGKLVTNDDPRFKGKVIVAVVSGTWCPNCHDEAQYLVELEKKYRDKGLAIVDFDFEEPDQQGTLERARAFEKQYGIKYTTLLAGAPSEMHEKVPQLNNLDTWPATIFIGRDGKVKAVHAGFSSPASGKFYTGLKQEFSNRIEHLLSESAS